MSTATRLVATDAPNFGSSEPKLASMSFAELDSAITERAASLKTKLADLVPYLREMRELLSYQGKRTDLRGVPKGLTWQKWVEQKKDLLGSLATVKRALRGERKKKRSEKILELSQLEAHLLGAASAGHDLVKAIQQGGNLDAAIREFRKAAPSPERIEEFIERPMKPIATISKLAANLVREAEAHFASLGIGQVPENLRLALADLKSELSLVMFDEHQQRPQRRYKVGPDSRTLGIGSKDDNRQARKAQTQAIASLPVEQHFAPPAQG